VLAKYNFFGLAKTNPYQVPTSKTLRSEVQSQHDSINLLSVHLENPHVFYEPLPTTQQTLVLSTTW